MFGYFVHSVRFPFLTNWTRITITYLAPIWVWMGDQLRDDLLRAVLFYYYHNLLIRCWIREGFCPWARKIKSFVSVFLCDQAKFLYHTISLIILLLEKLTKISNWQCTNFSLQKMNKQIYQEHRNNPSISVLSQKSNLIYYSLLIDKLLFFKMNIFNWFNKENSLLIDLFFSTI